MSQNPTSTHHRISHELQSEWTEKVSKIVVVVICVEACSFQGAEKGMPSLPLSGRRYRLQARKIVPLVYFQAR